MRWNAEETLSDADTSGYTDFRLDAISTCVRCTACSRSYGKARNYSDVTLIGDNCDDMTFVSNVKTLAFVLTAC